MDLELLELLAEAGQPAFRAGQVWSWAARGASSYEASGPDAIAAFEEHGMRVTVRLTRGRDIAAACGQLAAAGA